MSLSEFGNHALSRIFNLKHEEVKPIHIEKLVELTMREKYSEQTVDEVMDREFALIHEEIKNEYNLRLGEGLTIPFLFEDASGIYVLPHPGKATEEDVLDGLRGLTATEFEVLGGCILLELGFDEVYVTTASHDQGIDAFGMKSESVRGVVVDPRQTAIVQAKHYSACEISSHDIREYVGSVLLSEIKAYALKGDKYPQLSILKYTPTRVIYLTTGRVKRTAEILCRKVGIQLISADQLCKMFATFGSSQLLRKYIDDLTPRLVVLEKKAS